MIEIRTATEALTAAQRLIDAGANAGFADLATVRDVLASPASEPDSPSHPGWVSVAQRCPDPLLSSALHRAAGLKPRQRDSVGMSALAALARS